MAAVLTAVDQDTLLTKIDLARKFNVGIRTIENWMATGKIPYFRLGHVVRFRLEDVVRHVEQHYLVGAKRSPLRGEVFLQERLEGNDIARAGGSN